MEQIPWSDRVHMSQYYVIALHNLGRLDDQIPDLAAYLEEVVAVLDQVDPGANFFPNGIAYPYIIELAMITGYIELVPEAAFERMVDALADLEKKISIDSIDLFLPAMY